MARKIVYYPLILLCLCFAGCTAAKTDSVIVFAERSASPSTQTDAASETSILSREDIEPEIDAMPETDIEPETDAMPETDIEPETDAMPETDIVLETTPASETTAAPEMTSALEANVQTYVLNLNTKKFHLPECASAKRIKEANRGEFIGNRDEILAAGYAPCKNCNP